MIMDAPAIQTQRRQEMLAQGSLVESLASCRHFFLLLNVEGVRDIIGRGL